MVADRESDIYDIFVEAEQHPTPADFVIRSRVPRSTPEKDKQNGSWAYKKIRDEVASSDFVTVRQVELLATAKRTASLEVRAKRLTVKPPHARDHLPSVTLNVVLVEEVDGPNDGTDVCWLLLTSLPITNKDDVLRVIDIYVAR